MELTSVAVVSNTTPEVVSDGANIQHQQHSASTAQDTDVQSEVDLEEGRSGSSVSTAGPRALEWSIEKMEVNAKGGKKKLLLQDIAGRTESGDFTAIMGPSGSGKTTLIECLSLRNRNFDGALHLDGKVTGADYFTSAALVHQKELLFGFMTVKEHLFFHAVTKMSNHFTKEQMAARIEAVMKQIHLEKCADTLIGGVDSVFAKKGLSGGERKRVIIATELLLCPSLIFLDEPTSGLDSVMAESVIHTLKELVRKDVVVMTSIHSPTSEMVRLFSHMILLTTGGRLAYHGPMPTALAHFETLGHRLPKGYSPTEFFLRLVSKSCISSAASEAEEAKVAFLVHAWKRSTFNTRKIALPAETSHKYFAGVQGQRVSWYELWKLNVWRGLLQTRRDLSTFAMWGAAMTVLGLIFGILYLGQAQSNWRNLMGCIFATVVAIMFMATIANMVRFPLEWSVVLREYMGGSNAMGPYIAGKVVYDLPYIYGPFLLATVLYWMTGMANDAWSYVQFTGLIILINQCAVGLGLFISSFSPNPLVGLSLVPAVVTPMIMFSGMLYPRSLMPTWLSWIQDVSICNYGFEALMAITMKHLDPTSNKLIVQYTELDPNGLKLDIGMLLVILCVSYLLTYANLRLRLQFANINI